MSSESNSSSEIPSEDGMLSFMMGNFAAKMPTDRHYSTLHQWLKNVGGNRYRVGLTDYSVRLLKDVYFLEWSVDAGTNVSYRQEIGEVESAKAVSSLYAPIAGEDIQFNELLLSDPSYINSSTYDKGWLFEITTQAPMLSAEDYIALLDKNWEHTQRVIKGQVQ